MASCIMRHQEYLCAQSGDWLKQNVRRHPQDVSEEALINDQQLFRARREYELREAAVKAAEAAERCVLLHLLGSYR